MVRDTPSHGSDHLCLIWKESIHNLDVTERTRHARRTDRRTDGQSETSIPPPPQQLRCAGGIIIYSYNIYFRKIIDSLTASVNTEACVNSISPLNISISDHLAPKESISSIRYTKDCDTWAISS